MNNKRIIRCLLVTMASYCCVACASVGRSTANTRWAFVEVVSSEIEPIRDLGEAGVHAYSLNSNGLLHAFEISGYWLLAEDNGIQWMSSMPVQKDGNVFMHLVGFNLENGSMESYYAKLPNPWSCDIPDTWSFIRKYSGRVLTLNGKKYWYIVYAGHLHNNTNNNILYQAELKQNTCVFERCINPPPIRIIGNGALGVDNRIYDLTRNCQDVTDSRLPEVSLMSRANDLPAVRLGISLPVELANAIKPWGERKGHYGLICYRGSIGYDGLLVASAFDRLLKDCSLVETAPKWYYDSKYNKWSKIDPDIFPYQIGLICVVGRTFVGYKSTNDNDIPVNEIKNVILWSPDSEVVWPVDAEGDLLCAGIDWIVFWNKSKRDIIIKKKQESIRHAIQLSSGQHVTNICLSSTMGSIPSKAHEVFSGISDDVRLNVNVDAGFLSNPKP